MFKKILIFFGAIFFIGAAHAATDFRVASQLLAAAKAGDVKYVEILVNAGADVNYVDNTGLSIVCTALMNKDMRAAQILQVYGADASKCDQQIKQYNQRLPKEDSGGLFSGLSTPQSIALAAGGAAIVAGGIWGLTKLFGSGGGDGDGSNAGRPNNNNNGGAGGGGGTSPTQWVIGGLPIGPSPDYNPNFFSPSDTNDIRNKDFNHFNAQGVQNYMLMMYGYSPLARGYMGMRTLRYADKTPFPLNGITYNGRAAGGGRPIATAIVTTNGINPTGSAEDGWLVWAECNGAPGASSGCTSAIANSGTVSRKYYNNTITRVGDDLSNWTVTEDTSFDLSGNGTVFNASATDDESMLAKIVGGWYADGRTNGDYLGFMPNGQLIVYRTGGGNSETIDIHNFKALFLAAGTKVGGVAISDVVVDASPLPKMRHSDTTTISGIIAQTNSLTGANKTAAFLDMINTFYDNAADVSDTYNPGQYAGMLFAGQGTLFSPMIIRSTGEYEIGNGPGKSPNVQEATLENAAPLFYSNLNQKFMSIIAVQLDGTGTAGLGNVTDYGTTGFWNNHKMHLAAWTDDSGTPGVPADDRFYGARACGLGGKGSSTVDPWCFASAGRNAQEATVAAAGSVGAIWSAFSYMSTEQVFTLLALTADGPWLGTIGGVASTDISLKNYLQARYVLPNEYQFRVDSGEDYLDVFAEVFGYGMINLERAVTPGKKVFYYGTGTRINNAAGNAYWRIATTNQIFANTAFSTSGAFGARSAVISVPIFDELTSVDGSIAMPRVFENNFSIGSGRRGLYMGDVLGEFKTKYSKPIEKDGMTFDMAFSDSVRTVDRLGGLSYMSFSTKKDNVKFGGRFQRHFSDTQNIVSRGDASNPIFALASNAITTDAIVQFGKWSFGATAISGSITDETLLENDPAVTNMYEPARLGWVGGAQSSIGFNDGQFSFKSAVGFMRESDTTLGTYSSGLLNMGGGNTVYLDNVVSYSPTDYLQFNLRGTVSRTDTNPSLGFISDVSSIDSDAISFGADIGNFSFVLSRPLAVSNGNMKYVGVDYNIVMMDNGFELNANPYTANLDLRPESRETRFSAAYRHDFGDFTTGAIGFIYRLNPNHTDNFGDEGIVMIKLNHKLGI